MRLHKRAAVLLDVYGALDSFEQDILSAPHDSSGWKKVTDQELIWQGSEADIGWIWSNGSLYRITGTYTEKEWAHSTKNIVSRSLSHIHFLVHRNKQAEIMRVTASFDAHVRSIVLRNKRYYGTL